MAGILDLFRLDGKVAIVTGSNRGLGQAMAIALAQAGADIVGATQSAASPDTEGVDEPRSRPRSNLIIDRIVSTLAVVAAERAFAALGIKMPSLTDAPAAPRDSPGGGRGGQ